MAVREIMLSTRHLGRPLRIFDELDSTNTHALALADDPSRNGLTLLARQQSAGRGQYGRTWNAAPDSSVLMSILLFPPPPLRRPVLLTAWVAVAVAQYLTRVTGLSAKIKWPNDVLVNGRKICGILIEQRTSGHSEFPLASVIGIGLNVQQSADDFGRAGLPLAGSLCTLTDRAFDTPEVALGLIEQLDAEYGRMLAGDLGTLESLWRTHLDLLGKDVCVELHDGIAEGKLAELTFEGLILSDGDEPRQIVPEAIKHITLSNS